MVDVYQLWDQIKKLKITMQIFLGLLMCLLQTPFCDASSCITKRQHTFCSISEHRHTSGPMEYSCNRCSSVAFSKREASKHDRKHFGNPVQCACKYFRPTGGGGDTWMCLTLVQSSSFESSPSGADTVVDTAASTSHQSCQDNEVPFSSQSSERAQFWFT